MLVYFSAHCKHLLRIANLTDIERKMALYKSIFYCGSGDDTTPNFIKVENLRIELMAGGLTWEQQDYVIDKLNPNEYREVHWSTNLNQTANILYTTPTVMIGKTIWSTTLLYTRLQTFHSPAGGLY